MLDHIDELGQLFRCSLTADGDPERGIDGLRRDLHCLQNMTAVTLGAGAARGYTDAVILQNVDGVLRRQAGNRQGKNAGRIVGTVDDKTL